ncbi:MAG: hypothetical protein KDC14_06690 [Planctomycetes bacterium]|nr:hypothetical protein [Planctomycetota bacterium]MCB9610820.1 hypothetical protein [Polyangiaceae bacterium]
MRRAPPRGLWQSFADLAMGVMAVVILVLLVVLRRQADESEEFTRAILEALEGGQAVIRSQDSVNSTLEALFRVGECQLRYDASTGRLTLGDPTDTPTELYATGGVTLHPAAQSGLKSCGDALLTLSICLDANRATECEGRLRDSLGADYFTHAAMPAWGTVDTLAIQGHTDAQPYDKANPIGGLGSRLERHQASFVANADLGSERARQAMAHLIASVRGAEAGSDGVTNALLAHLSIESSAFGRFQADLSAPAEGCVPDREECASARRLALQIRWTPDSLQEPLEKVRAAFCRRQMRLVRAQGQKQSKLHDQILKVCEGVR